MSRSARYAETSRRMAAAVAAAQQEIDATPERRSAAAAAEVGLVAADHGSGWWSRRWADGMVAELVAASTRRANGG